MSKKYEEVSDGIFVLMKRLLRVRGLFVELGKELERIRVERDAAQEEVIELRVLEMNHEGACVRLKNELEEAKRELVKSEEHRKKLAHDLREARATAVDLWERLRRRGIWPPVLPWKRLASEAKEEEERGR